MGERYAAVGTAIKELRVLKGNLDTYREVWSEDGNQEGEGQDGYGEGVGGGDELRASSISSRLAAPELRGSCFLDPRSISQVETFQMCLQ